MMSVWFLASVLCSGILVEPFPLAEPQPDHFQVSMDVAMAPDGRFVVAWTDSLQLPDRFELEVFLRFFDRDGNPLTEPQKITKLADTSWVNNPCLGMDSAGNVVLLWAESDDRKRINGYPRFQLFNSEGNPVGAPQTVGQQTVCLWSRPVDVTCNSRGEFAVVWAPHPIRARRYSASGVPVSEDFKVHDSLPDISFKFPQAALNDAGDLAVTWFEGNVTNRNYPRFQVFDSDNKPVLGWEPKGHRLDDEGEVYAGTRSEVHWLDDDRFIAFWFECCPHPIWLVGRVFSDRGMVRHPVRKLVSDSLNSTDVDTKGQFISSVSPDDRFALTHTHSYWEIDTNTGEFDSWTYAVGSLGYIEEDVPLRRTTLFEYSTLREDSMGAGLNECAVAACNDRIVWVWSEWNPDTILNALVMITDWDMGKGIAEQPTVQSPIELQTSINRLSYAAPGEAELTLFSADGRRVLVETINGKGTWTPSSQPSSHLPSGVYFAKITSPEYSVRAKVVIIH